MKNLKIILLIAVISTLIISCSNSDTYQIPTAEECVDLTVTKTIQDIATVATNTVQQYSTTDDDVIEAYVTSSDEGGNFYKSISLVSIDGTKGFSIPVDDYNLYTKFEPGRKVFIKLKGKYFYNNSLTSTLEIGNLYDNGAPLTDEIGRILGVEYQDVILKSCTKVDENTIVNSLTIPQVVNNNNLNKLIELDGVQFVDSNVGKTYYDKNNEIGGATNNTIIDSQGNSLTVRVSEFASFAGNSVPSLNGKIRGVLTKFGTGFQFMIRTLNDVMLTNPRFDASPAIVGNALTYTGTLTENFESYTTSSPANRTFPNYINDALIGSRYWATTTFGGNKYIQISSFGGTAENNRSLFFVPVDMTAANTFSFQSKAGFSNGSVLKVYYILATDYTPGGVVDNSKLVNITSSFTISPGLSSGYPTNFTNSGNYLIPASLTGNGYFVFEYVGSGITGLTTTMQIDNVVVN